MIKKLILDKYRFLLCFLSLFSFFFTESSHAQLATKSTVTSANGAEISVFDPGTNRVFTVAGNAIEYYTLNSAGVLSSPTAIPYGFTTAAGTTALPNSVAINNGVLVFSFAVVNSSTNAQELGRVAFYNPATATYISDVTVGYLPDMVAFSPDGTKILTANEGEPNSYGVVGTSFDPEGSVSIIDISAGIASASVTEASFTSFNSQMASLKAAGVRIYGPGSTVAQDFEPEYITFINNTTAAVTLQENNAVAMVDIATGTVTTIYPLGLKDHSLTGNGFDASDRDLTSSTGKINIQNWPVKGMYMPDAIASFTSGGDTYFITANEGDSRAYTGYNEEIRVGAAGYVLDPTVFPTAATLKLNANLGRLQLSNASGDTDGDGDFDEIHALGARSFTIWNSSFSPVFDSGDQLEQITASQSAASFNSDGTSASFDGRSDNKGPEPEAVTTGTVNGVLYAFVGSERTGDVFMYDITNPAAPVFKQYINTAADLGVEGIIFVPASQSPTGNALVITSAEVSKTVSVYEFTPPSVNLAVSTNTASETAGTVVTVTATASEAVFGDKTVSVSVSGTNITAADYTLSNATITIPSGSTTGSVTFTIVSDNAVEALETAELSISNPSSGLALGTTTTQNITISDYVFTLQVLHASDFEAAVDAVQDAPRFAAIVDVLEDTYANTIKLSSGDNYIPGPFLSSGEDSSLSAALKTSYESYYNTTFSSSAVNLLPSIGRADISILNFIGIEASALGNHEFDLGTTEVRNIIRGANSSSTVRSWFGAQFPYLSSNLNFSGDSNLSAIATTDRLRLNTTFMSTPSEAVTAITNKTKLAPSTIIMKGGQKIGIVGATTQVLASISSPGATTVVGGGANDMTILAGIIQPVVNSLIADGCTKIILLSHLQQIAFEKELAGKLTGVDIIMAGGSNTLMADANDRLRAGDVAAESYPFLTTGLDGKALALINTDGNYKYVGRLVVDFDADGTLIPSSIDPVISGVYAADSQGLNDVWGANVANAYAVGTRGYQVQLLCTAVANVINVKDGNLFGKTAVFLEGRRNIIRTEETNLGNLSAEANLWMAKFYDPTTVISIKNGGGIRSAIGNVIAVGNDVTYAPPIANVGAGKQAGDISQLDIENSLRFNNKLSLVTLTATGLRAVLEHAVNATTATATPGQFAQVAGVRYSYNFSNAVGSKILNAVVTDASGNIIDTLVVNGVTQGDVTRTFRVVTLSFLAGGGDSYPFSTLGTSRSDLDTLAEQGPAMASFTTAGSEQDVFAEYMKSQYSTTPYGIAETALVNDCRVQRVPARADNVLPPSAGTNGTLVICETATVTENQLFAALGATPQTGGTWSPSLAGAGVYSYTVNSLCAGSASATVTVTAADALVASSASQGTVDCNSTTATVVVAATGGTAPYTGTGSFTVGAGSYSYTVTDANGCTAVTTGTVNTIADTTSPTIYFQPAGLLTGSTGPSTTQTPYLQSQSIGGKYTSILSVNDAVGGYKMVGIPDGLGAYDNNNGTFTLLMNHELGNTSGITRAHGSKGAFVSKWVINKSDLTVQSGSDLIQTVNTWNTTSNSFVTGTTAFNRFCSADLPSVPALYNAATGLGTMERIFLTGEESGAEGRAFGHIATGASAGVTYELPYLGKFSWENVVASPATGNKTVVAGTDDTSTNGQVYFYVGTKTNSGTEIDKAGLNNGKLFGVNVSGYSTETSSSIPADNTPFTLSDLGFVQNKTGATLNTESVTAGVTNFLRPEDGGFDPLNPNDFYFVTTNSITAPSRMWRLRFNDIANPENGGTITAVLDGTEGQKMLDNMTIDKLGHILLQEDPGGNAHNAKMWQYTIATDALELVGKHDAARFGEVVGGVTTPATSPYNNDEESSGVIDMSDILGPGMFLIDDQAHYTTGLANLSEVVQGGQLLAFFNPASVSATVSSAALATITACSGTGVVLGTPATADNCSIASLTNDAPATFPVGTTTVTWTATDASGNTATATQTVNVLPLNTYYADADGDGYGNAAVSQMACSQPTGYVTNSTDCNDAVAAINPDHVEVLYNGVDDNCDGQLDEGFQLTTNLQSVSCGVTLPSLGSLIYANINFSATAYRFKVINTATNAVQIINRGQHWFALNMLADYDYATTYTISVELQKAGIWLGYFGSTCEVSSPAILSPTGALQVNPSQCGATLASIGSVIATTPVSGATGYRFRVTDVTPGATGDNLIQVRNRSYHWFTLPMLTRFNYGSTYLVEVAVKTTSGYSGYGSACMIYSPAAPTLTSCGTIVPTDGSLVYTSSMNSVSQYRFQVTKIDDQSTVTFDTNKFWFSFRANVPGYTPETGYSVRVAVMTAGTWSPFGDACEIVSPAAAARGEVDSSVFEAQAFPNPFTSEFKLNVTTSTQGAVELKVYDMLGKLIETRSINTIDYISEDLGSAYPAGVYNVIVTQGENMKTLRMIKR